MSITIPGADYTPQLTGYTGQGAFRFWCQKVLPIVYDDSLSYYELLNKVVNYLNNVITDVASVENNIGQLNTSYINLQNFVNETNDNIETEINEFEDKTDREIEVFKTLTTTTVRELQNYMNHYFDNLDVQAEINNKLDVMASDGSLSTLIGPIVAVNAPDVITQWMSDHVTPTTPIVDDTLSISGAAADAKVTGDKIAVCNGKISVVENTTGNTIYYSDNFLDGYWFETRVGVAVDKDNPVSNDIGFSCIAVPCAEDQVFYLTGSGSTNAHTLYVFIDNSGNILSRSTSSANADMLRIVGPTNSAYLVCNARTTTPHFIISNELIKNLVDGILTREESNSGRYVRFIRLLTEQDDLDSITETGWYRWTSSHQPLNNPLAYAGKMLVLSGLSGDATQVVFPVTGLMNTNVPIIRMTIADSFTDWKRVPTEDRVKTLINNSVKLPSLSDLNLNDNTATENFEVAWDKKDAKNTPIKLSITSKVTSGSTLPSFRIMCYNGSDKLYQSALYEFGSFEEFLENEYIIPDNEFVTRYELEFIVPNGCSVVFSSFEMVRCSSLAKPLSPLVIHAHMGFDALYPSGSYNSITMAGKLGFESCVVIPKFTLDGVPVVFHDDSNISGQITQENGDPVPSEYDIPISQLTYSQLMQWSIGYSKSPCYAGAKILKLEDFFRICNKTGMRPIFSVHPSLSVSQWETIKGLLDKYNLTNLASFKSGDYQETWKRVIDVFGNGNFYSIISIYGTTSNYDMLQHLSAGISYAGVDVTKTRLDAEFFDSGLQSAGYGEYQMQQLRNCINAGYISSVVLQSYTPSNRMKMYIEMGVKEFTNGRHCSLGLNW